MRRCQICREHKELSEFFKDSSKSTGYSYKCKICHNIRKRDRARAQARPAREQKEARRLALAQEQNARAEALATDKRIREIFHCLTKILQKARTERRAAGAAFEGTVEGRRLRQRVRWARTAEKKKKQRRARYAARKPELAAQVIARRLRNPDAYRATKRTGRRNRRARKLAAFVEAITSKAWREIIARWGGRCAYCGRLPEESPLTMDHIQPLARGGIHARRNVAPACKRCNSLKSDRDPFEFIGAAAPRLVALSSPPVMAVSVNACDARADGEQSGEG